MTASYWQRQSKSQIQLLALQQRVAYIYILLMILIEFTTMLHYNTNEKYFFFANN